VVITDENLRGVKTSSIQTAKKETGNSVEIKSVNSRHTDNNNRAYKMERAIKNKERNYTPRRRRIEHARTASEYSNKSNSGQPFRHFFLALLRKVGLNPWPES
jgi:hypothetical protein